MGSPNERDEQGQAQISDMVDDGTSDGPVRAATARRPPIARAALPLGGAVAAVLVLALGFSFLFRALGTRPTTTVTPTATVTAHPSPTNTSMPFGTATPAPITKGTPLAWQAVTLPPGFTASHTLTNILAPSPANGQTAYACFFPPNAPDGAPPRVWATHDAAQTWAPLANPAVGAVRSCTLVVDGRLPNTVVLGLGASAPPGPEDQDYVTTDGGATWHALPRGLVITSLATYVAHGTSSTYAVVDTTSGAATFTSQVQVSRDAFQTWRSVDIGAGAGETPLQLWMQPESGELLVETSLSGGGFALYASKFGVSNWSQVTSVTDGRLIVEDPAPGEPYRVCRAAAPGDQSQPPLACNLNILLSDTFPARLDPLPALAIGGTPTSPQVYVTITTDGSLLALASQKSGDATTYTLYRLPPGGTNWQDVGSVPGFQLVDTISDAERLWAMPENGIELDPQGRVFVARVEG